MIDRVRAAVVSNLQCHFAFINFSMHASYQHHHQKFTSSSSTLSSRMNNDLIPIGLANLHGGGGRDECVESKNSRQRGSEHTRHGFGTSRMQHQQKHHTFPVSSVANGSGKEAMVLQKLQGALTAVRRERDQEFRYRNMAREKLRSAKEASWLIRNVVEEELSKLNKTTNEAQQATQKIQQMEGSIVDLKRKVRFVTIIINQTRLYLLSHI
jgi:hypothetical protein